MFLFLNYDVSLSAMLDEPRALGCTITNEQHIFAPRPAKPRFQLNQCDPMDVEELQEPLEQLNIEPLVDVSLFSRNNPIDQQFYAHKVVIWLYGENESKKPLDTEALQARGTIESLRPRDSWLIFSLFPYPPASNATG